MISVSARINPVIMWLISRIVMDTRGTLNHRLSFQDWILVRFQVRVLGSLVGDGESDTGCSRPGKSRNGPSSICIRAYPKYLQLTITE